MRDSLELVAEWQEWMKVHYSPDTLRTYEYPVLRFLAHHAHIGFRSVNEVHVTRWLNVYAKNGPSKASYICGLRSFFRWCLARDYIERDPTALIRPKGRAQKPAVACDEEELFRVLCAALWRDPSGRRYWTLLLGYGLGVRRKELASIRPEDVDLHGMEIELVTTKGNRPRIIEISPTAAAALKGLRPWWDGTVLGGIKPSTVTQWAHRAAVDAGLVARKSRSHVIMRASYATHLSERGAADSVVSALLGHANLGVTSRYIAASKKRRRAAADLI